MKVKMFYDNGHFDMFDTDSHVEKVLRRNVVSDYSFDLKEHDGQELWLTIYYHEKEAAAQSDDVQVLLKALLQRGANSELALYHLCSNISKFKHAVDHPFV